MIQENPFLNQVFPRVLIFLLKRAYPKYFLKIARELNSTYSTISKAISELIRMKLITIKKEGRRKIIKLTPTGLQVAVLLIDIQNIKKKRF